MTTAMRLREPASTVNDDHTVRPPTASLWSLGLRGVTALLAVSLSVATAAGDFQRLRYGDSSLVVDLGVGLWAQPLPMDFDGDGDWDLVVATNDKPSNGIYFFENPGDGTFPVFKPGVRLGAATGNLEVSFIGGKPIITAPGKQFPGFRTSALTHPVSIPYKPTFYAGRANQWRYCDYDGDGRTDLIIGASDWRDYGWDNAFNAQGNWTRDPLHGYVYVVRNTGTDEQPHYVDAVQVQADGKPLDVFGRPSPCLADWDGDGDLDLLCGEFLDGFTYFENIGVRQSPRYAAGRRLMCEGQPLTMELQMIVPVTVDWDDDGDFDLIVGQEDGRVAWIECTGRMVDRLPEFRRPRFFRQQADAVKCGALATPSSADWDGDGDEDLICGDTAGFLSFIENRGGRPRPRWRPPVRLQAGGKVVRIQAGVNGSIQGPAEAKWGYTVPCVADWDDDGRLDVVVNSIWGAVVWFRNIGSRTAPRLAVSNPIEVEWAGPPPKPEWNWWKPRGRRLVTQWRTTPLVTDLDGDGLNDLVMLDCEGYLSWFQRRRVGSELRLLPPQRIFHDDKGRPLRLNSGKAGKSGRRKFTMADWDGDGRRDLLVNSRNIDWLQNIGEGGAWVFRNRGPVAQRRLAGHTTCPTTVDWDGNGVCDLLVGAEDGFLYHLPNPAAGER